MPEPQTTRDEPMTSTRSETRAGDVRRPGHQDKWLPVWDELQPFRAGTTTPGRGGGREALRADHVPVPQRRPAHGPCRGDRAARRDRAVLVAARLRGAQPDGLGLVRVARGERRDPQQRAPGGVHLRQHRDPVRVVPAVRVGFDWTRRLQHQRPGVLPVDPVAVPEVPRARAGLPQEQPGELVPERPDRAGQRAGRRGTLRALRRRGDQAGADPVVLQDHRLRPAAAGRHGPLEATWPDRVMAAQRNWIGRSEGAHVEFQVEGHEPLIRVYTTRPDTLFGATFMVVAADAQLAADWSRTSSGRRRGVPGGDPDGLGRRPDGDRAAEDRCLPGRARDQPGDRRGDPGLGRGLRPGRLRHRRDHGGARPGPA